MSGQIEKPRQAGRCLVCQKEVGFFRKLTKNRFCTDEHEQQYMDQLKYEALGRLQSAGARLTRPDKVHV